jgi:hypothetical protein
VILDVHEDKCVNIHWWILKMDYKQQTTVLSVIFVLVGMMILVPAITGKAEAVINATVRLHGEAAKLTWTLLEAHMNLGVFTRQPTQKGDQIGWNTRGTDASGHDENGFVKYGTGAGDITFRFNNPFIGTNTCKMTVENPTLRVDCSITQGNFASLTYNVYHVNGGNGGEDEGAGGGGDEGGGSDDEGGGY